MLYPGGRKTRRNMDIAGSACFPMCSLHIYTVSKQGSLWENFCLNMITSFGLDAVPHAA